MYGIFSILVSFLGAFYLFYFFCLLYKVFAIRRKRKESNNHVIEIKLPSEVDSDSNAANNGTKNANSSSKLLSKDVIIDLEEIENEPVFSSSGDALLGREATPSQKGLFANHNWERKMSPAVARAFGLNATPKSPSSKTAKSRNALFPHQQQQQQQQQLQQKSQRNAWQSDANLMQYAAIQRSPGKLSELQLFLKILQSLFFFIFKSKKNGERRENLFWD